jgi:hypothetical protein
MTASRLWAVVALCVLQGSGWIPAQAWSSEVGYPFAVCIHFAVIGCVATILAMRGGGLRVPFRWSLLVAPAGLGLFVVPVLVLRFAAGVVPEAAGVGIFCAVPVMILIGEMLFGDAGSRARGLLLPGVLALGAALLLFQVEPPASPRRWLFFALVAACCVVVAAASIWLHRLLRGVGIASAVAVVGLGGAVVFFAYGANVGWPVLTAHQVAGEVLRGMVFDLPVLWLTLWLVREVDPARLSARFLLVPMVNLAEGYALLRQPVELRAILEMAAMLGGAAMLLVREEPDEPPGLRLR